MLLEAAELLDSNLNMVFVVEIKRQIYEMYWWAEFGGGAYPRKPRSHEL